MFKEKEKNSQELAKAVIRAVLLSRLYRERLSQVNSKLAEVEAGRAAEYLEPLAVLLENMQVRTKVAGNSSTSTRTRKCSHTLATPIHSVFICFSSVFVRYLQRAVSGVSQEQV